jgi:hypothetical protein
LNESKKSTISYKRNGESHEIAPFNTIKHNYKAQLYKETNNIQQSVYCMTIKTTIILKQRQQHDKRCTIATVVTRQTMAQWSPWQQTTTLSYI